MAIDETSRTPVILVLINTKECEFVHQTLIAQEWFEFNKDHLMNFSWAKDNGFVYRLDHKKKVAQINQNHLILTTFDCSYGQDFANPNMKRNHVIVTYDLTCETEFYQLLGRSNRYQINSSPHASLV